MQKLGKKQLILNLQNPHAQIPEALSAWPVAMAAKGYDLIYTYDAQQERTGITEFLAALGNEDIAFKDLETTQSSLEDIFVDLEIGRASCGESVCMYV